MELVLQEELLETRLVSRFHSKAWLLGLKANGDQPKGEKLLFCGLRATEHSNGGMKVERFSVDSVDNHHNFIPTV